MHDINGRWELEKATLEIAAREQQWIGFDLHDGLCQELAGIAFGVQSLQRASIQCGLVDPSELGNITRMLQQAVRHARVLSRSLYPVPSHPSGLAMALGKLASDTSDLHKIECKLECAHPVEVRALDAAMHLYRVAVGALREAVLYGKADRVVIGLARDKDLIMLTITDDGLPLGDRFKHDMILHVIQHHSRIIGATLQLQDGPDARGVRVACEFHSSEMKKRLK
jgi:signal transduction histidine kinase